MANLVKFEPRDDLSELTLIELFRRAEGFGNVGVFSDRDKRPPKCYKVSIEFDSIPGTEVKAGSDFSMAIEDALIQAISRAELIVQKYADRGDRQ